ncbi:hypothetical protein [Hornefia butyriciproducens]|nr:hypothetical protein [Hornefia butyriciproducens]MDY5462216.1 hypothetical protein [Hornefia butyriciproducens]
MKKYKFDYDEIRIIVMALNEMRNRLIQENRHTELLDELLVKLLG